MPRATPALRPLSMVTVAAKVRDVRALDLGGDGGQAADVGQVLQRGDLGELALRTRPRPAACAAARCWPGASRSPGRAHRSGKAPAKKSPMGRRMSFTPLAIGETCRAQGLDARGDGAAASLAEGDDAHRQQDEHDDRRQGTARPPRFRHPRCPALRSASRRGDQHALEGVELLEALSTADGNAVERVAGHTIGIPVSCWRRESRPCGRAPPPVSTMPCSMMSAASSGGVRSKVTLTASMMAATGSSMARRISSVEMTTVFGAGHEVPATDLGVQLLFERVRRAGRS